jgi:hypothetical protein
MEVHRYTDRGATEQDGFMNFLRKKWLCGHRDIQTARQSHKSHKPKNVRQMDRPNRMQRQTAR